MKKLILALIVALGVSVSVKAETFSNAIFAEMMPLAALGFLIMTQEEYRSCSNNKMLEGGFSDGKSNHTFNIEPCDYLDNPSKYTLKSS